MAFEINPKIYRITGGSLYATPCYKGDINLVVMKCYGKLTIEAYSPADGIGPAGVNKFKSWRLSARNTKFSSSAVFYLYARVSRVHSVGELIYSIHQYNINGTAIDDTSIPESQDYYYILVGKLTRPSVEYTTFDFDYGYLGSQITIEDTKEGFDKLRPRVDGIEEKLSSAFKIYTTEASPPMIGTLLKASLTVEEVGAIEPELNWDEDERKKHVGDQLVFVDGTCYSFRGDYIWRVISDRYLIATVDQLEEQKRQISEIEDMTILTTSDNKSLANTLESVKNVWQNLYNRALKYGVATADAEEFKAYATACITMYEYILERGNVKLGPIEIRKPSGEVIMRRLGVKYSAEAEAVDGVIYRQYAVAYTLEPETSRMGWADYYQSYEFYMRAQSKIQDLIYDAMFGDAQSARSRIAPQQEYSLGVEERDGVKYVQLLNGGSVVSEINTSEL